MMLNQTLRLPFLIASLWIVGSAASSRAAVIITLGESGGDVVANASGSLDLTGLRFTGAGAVPVLIYPAVGAITVGPFWDSVENYDGLTAWPSNFGPGGSTVPDSTSGIFFAVAGDSFAIQRFYQNFEPLSGSSTWLNATLDQLGVSPGTYTWNWSTDSITLNVVPEPTTCAMALAGLACGGYLVRWRRKRA